MHNSLVVVVILWAYIASPFIASASQSIDNKLSKCSFEDINDARKNYFIEQDMISRTGGRVFRKGLRLELRTAKRVIVFNDNCSDTESYARYSFRGHLTDIGYYLVSATASEGGEYILISDRTGKKIYIEDTPVISPDKKRFVTMSMDLLAANRNNSIQIWRIEEHVPKLEYNADFDFAWGPSDPIWKDNGTIEFKKNVLNKITSDLESSPALLRRKGKTWIIEKISQ